MSEIEFDDTLVTPDARVECDNCDWEGGFADPIFSHVISDPGARIGIGAPAPAGECPDCGALCYLVQPEPPKRVLVWVRGGVADGVWEPGVEVLLVDYDNEPDAEIPDEFQRLLGKSADQSR